MLQNIHVLVMHVQLPGADNVSEVLDLIGEPRALFQVEGNPGFAETVKNRVNVFDVSFRVRGEDDDVVSVDKAYLPLQAREDNIQRTLKGSRRVRQAERHG